MREFTGGYADLGKEAGNVDFSSKVQLVIKNIHDYGLLRNNDDPAYRADKARAMFGQIGPAVVDVGVLESTLQDPNKVPVQRENAAKSLDILAKATCWYMLHSDDEEMVADIGLGDLQKIEERLPTPFKGLGERVRSSVIDEPQILERLEILDKIRERTKKAGESGRQTLAVNIQGMVNELTVIGVDSTKEDQLGMVIAFLGVEADRLAGVERVVTAGGGPQQGRGGEIPPWLTSMMGKEGDPAQQAAMMSAYAAMESGIRPPTTTNHDEIAKWTFQMTDMMAREPLFWAGSGWQQIGPCLARQIQTKFMNEKMGAYEVRMAKEKRFVQSVVACRMQEQTILHADGTPSRYIELLPPPGNMTDYLWKEETVKMLEGRFMSKICFLRRLRLDW